MTAPAERCLLAVDGGNTKTLAVVASASGDVLATGRAGCSDIYNAASPDAALEEVERAVTEALARADVAREAIAGAAFSLAGADWPEDFELLQRELAGRLGIPAGPLVVNDALGALRAGAPAWEGIAVVSGTYNAVGARRADGARFHLGFWPDGAGGRNIAQAALRAVYRADLGLGPETVLTERALALYGASDAIDLLHAFTRRGGLPREAQDRLAPVVLGAAEEGDAVARAIVLEKGRILGEQARVCAARAGLGLDGTLTVLSGGVFGHPSDILAGAVMAQLPGAEPVRHGPPPVVGALLLAFDGAGLAADPRALHAALVTDPRSLPWAASPSSM